MKQCKYCHAELVRKVLKGGRLEPNRLYRDRDFCDLRHFHLWRKYGPMPIIEQSNEMMDLLINILVTNPDGLKRQVLAEKLEVSDRTMRRIVSDAADKMLNCNPPMVLGYCDKRRVYKIAQNNDEALSIWWTSAGRGFKLIRRQKKMLEVIKREFQMTDQQVLIEIPAAGVGL